MLLSPHARPHSHTAPRSASCQNAGSRTVRHISRQRGNSKNTNKIPTGWVVPVGHPFLSLVPSPDHLTTKDRNLARVSGLRPTRQRTTDGEGFEPTLPVDAGKHAFQAWASSTSPNASPGAAQHSRRQGAHENGVFGRTRARKTPTRWQRSTCGKSRLGSPSSYNLPVRPSVAEIVLVLTLIVGAGVFVGFALWVAQ